MGLDWHTVDPCERVQAPRMRDRGPGWADAVIRQHREDIADAAALGRALNAAYVAHWTGMTAERLAREIGGHFDCENCPLLRELDGADSTRNPFLGATVKSCDFRGKLVTLVEGLSEALIDEAYRPHAPEEMLRYARDLEAAVERMRAVGAFGLAPGATRQRHPDEAALLDAVRWLRVCAGHQIAMEVSY